MTLSIVILNNKEEFIRFLDPDLCSIKETCTINGLRTIDFEYIFQDMKKDKELFRLGNKIWIQGDNNLTDCLYLINTSVKQDVFKENSFTFDAEEVLVELTYAPLLSHLDLTAANGFNLTSENGNQLVKVDYNSLHSWFGEWFNIGVVQDCLSEHASFISFTGTITPMALLRQIESETGNVFITRYEKDVLNNTIHRYLDFLNPINVSKNWTFNLEYEFVKTDQTHAIYDVNDNLTSDDNQLTVKPYTSTIPDESLDDTIADGENDGEELYEGYTETARDETYDPSEQEVENPELIKEFNPLTNLNPANCTLRIVNHDGELLNNNGEAYTDGDTALEWDATTLGLTDNTQTAVISLTQNNNKLGIDINDKSVVIVQGTTDQNIKYVSAIKNGTLNPSYIQEDGANVNVIIPDDSYLEFYDHVNFMPIFRAGINRSIGTVHEEVLDLGFNLENVVHNIDESDTYSSVSPVITLDENTDSANSLSRTQVGDIIQRWIDLDITKGEPIPMIIQRVNVQSRTVALAKRGLGSYDGLGGDESTSKSNWWRRPYKPQDQTNDNDANQNRWEFLKATANWNAPYTKRAGNMFVETDKEYLTQFSHVYRKPDNRDEKGMVKSPKNGTVSTTEEDVFAIYNQVVSYLKEHETPEINLDLDVANLRNGEFNNYQIWDKIYIKIPDTEELIVCRVTEISKEAHDVAKNTIKVANYTPNNNLRTITKGTVIHASNISYKYPSSKKLTVTLENTDYTEGSNDIQYPANKLLNFTLYTVENGTATFKKNYTKKTDAYGNASIQTKLDPGDYKFEVRFGGDEEFSETLTTCKVAVSGTKEVKTNNTSSSNSKTTKKTTKKVTKTTYYNKYGLSPDKKKILAIGRKSASRDSGSYANFYVMEFQNKCPHCGKATLYWSIFYAGNEYSNTGIFPATGRREGGSAEGHIFCKNCDADYSCQGFEHVSGGKRLTVTKSRKLSSKADAYKLKKGKYVYNQKTKTVKTKKVTNTKNRKVIGKVSSTIKNLALNIVGEKTGYKALREICSWMDKHVDYVGYSGFLRSPETVAKKGGNCCDQTRLLMKLCDAAGLTEYYKMYYTNVQCPEYGHVFALFVSKSTGNKVYIDPASDTHACYGYICDRCPRAPGKSRYPSQPF